MPLLRRAVSTLALALALPLAAAAAPAHAFEAGIVQTGQEQGIDPAAETSALGAEWVRMFVDWSTYEPGDDRYDAFWERHFNDRLDGAARRGQKVLLVVTRSPAWASGSSDVATPPRDPAEYGEFLNYLATKFRGRTHAFEVWNEPDEPGHWNPAPDAARYAALLNAAHAGVKAANPGAVVVSGGLVGNNYRFLEQVVDAGGTGFDAVGVHTDTACLTSPADEQYREPDGRIGRFSFTGYREVRQSLMARGIDKPIWMTEMGWSTLTSVCTIGARAGTKPSGVTPEKQAQYLTHAFSCLQRDPYVSHAFWFSLQDIGGEARYDHYLGLFSLNGTKKPAWAAFHAFATGAQTSASTCATDVDVDGPRVDIQSPAPNTPFLDKVVVRANATDAQGVSGTEMYVDGKKIGGKQNKPDFFLEWNGAKDLSIGEHTLTIRAYDNAKNVGEATVTIVKADPNTLKVGKAVLSVKVKRGKGRKVVVSGRVSAPGAPVQPKGKVRLFFEYQKVVKRKGRRPVTVWAPYSRFTKDAKKSFRFSFTLRKPGVWRMYSRYTGQAPFRAQRTGYVKLGRVR